MNRYFPSTPAEFESDTRIAYSAAESKWILEDDDGSEWEYQEMTKEWVPAVPLEETADSTATVLAQGQPARSNRRNAYDGTGDDDTSTPKPKKQKLSKRELAPPANTAIYITSLPLDVTVDEVNDTFKRFGIIAEEVDSGKPRIKLYTNDSGEFKGDSLVVYFKRESVQLAIDMMDETDFRFGVEGPAGKMRVTEADRSYKKQQDNRPKDGSADGKKKGPSKDQKKIMKKTQKLNNKLADWSDDETSALKQTSSRFDKVVVLKHMFTLKELEEEPEAMLEIKEDIREECDKVGQVTNVSLYDKEEDGIVTVRFTTTEAANACVRWMSGRQFSAREVVAYISDGTERFKRSNAKKAVTEEENESDEEERIERFGEFLEGN